MKIRPVILCGGAGTRLWPNSKNHQAKQFIDFGSWTLFGKTLERTKASIFDAPVISTNKKYLKQIKQHLRKYKINNYKLFNNQNVNLLPLICYEIIFPKLVENKIRQFNFIVNISEDAWFGESVGPEQHFTKAIFRSIETKAFTIRSANKGVSAFIGPDGKILKLNP